MNMKKRDRVDATIKQLIKRYKENLILGNTAKCNLIINAYFAVVDRHINKER